MIGSFGGPGRVGDLELELERRWRERKIIVNAARMGRR